MSTYQKWSALLSMHCVNIQTIAQALAQAPLANTLEDINARIIAAEKLGQYAADAKRSLLYFKNRLARDIL